MDQYLAVWKKFADFNGRARRKEYWMFVLFSVIISVVLGVIDGVAGTPSAGGYGLLGGLYVLAIFVPALAVTVRRLHDTNRSGWFILLGFIPCIGIIILIVFYAEDGTKGSNQFGSDPKGGERVADELT